MTIRRIETQISRQNFSFIGKRSLIGLNAINFFQAEMVGVLLPILGVLLKEHGWRYESIGVATAAGGFGTLLMQTPAGVLTDRISSRRFWFGACAIATGICFVGLPLLAAHHVLIDSLLGLAGAIQSFFGPLLGALALALVGHAGINKLAGTNQSWNHAGNIAAALTAMGLVRWFGVSSVFYSVGISSMLAAAAVLLIRRKDLREGIGAGLDDDGGTESVRTARDSRPASWTELLRSRVILTVFVAIFLFHLANAPILPLTALYVKHLGGSDSLMTATVLTAQIVMVPMAIFAGRYGDRWGRKPMLAIAFWILPIRILSYTLAHNPHNVIWLQSLDGIGAGIYGVVVISLAADLTHGRGGFNTLAGLFATAVAIGGVVGPVISGFVVQHFGFKWTFFLFAGLAIAGASIFTLLVPETKSYPGRRGDERVRLNIAA